MMTTSSTSALLFLVAFLYSSDGGVSATRRNLLRTKRIVGGMQASLIRYPYFAAVYSSTLNETLVCGGTLIHEDIVLTNAHCDGNTFRIIVNQTSTTKATGFEYERTGIAKRIHPHYYHGITDDIMLIQLNESIPHNLIRPVQLANYQFSGLSSHDEGTNVTLLGFGSTTPDPTDSPLVDFKNEVEIGTIGFDECNEMYRSPITGRTPLVKELFFCTMGDGIDSCNGDSGGPVIIKGENASDDIQVGIISFGSQICTEKPGVHTNISHYADFIKVNICELSSNPPESCTTCPDSDLNIACVDLFDPVTCGECEYDTSCLATMAGFTPEIDCVPTSGFEDIVGSGSGGSSSSSGGIREPFSPLSCPPPSEDATCSHDFAPVMCVDGCFYDNLCWADASSNLGCTSLESIQGSIVSILPSCPLVPMGTLCPLQMEPVMCGECEYSNSCYAEISGFNVTKDCNSTIIQVINEIQSDAPSVTTTCPIPAADNVCIAIFDPVICGDCGYNNQCYADASGFDPDADCIRTGLATAITMPDSAPFCPTPASDSICTELHDPVLCGGCEYSNLCNASAAGFTPSTDCKSIAHIEEETPAKQRLCFSATSRVEVKNAGTIMMRDIRVGDEVLVDHGKYEQIYSFGHRDTEIETTFIQVMPSGLELSATHMVFVERKGFIAASTVRIGDRLSSGEFVKGIRQIVRRGVFNPFTPSGTIVVNGVRASNYIALQAATNTLLVGSFNTGLTFHWLDHMAILPHRIWHHYLGYTDKLLENGLSSSLYGAHKIGTWYLKQEARVVGILLIPLLTVLMMFALVESLLLHPELLLCALLMVSILLLRRRKKGCGINATASV